MEWMPHIHTKAESLIKLFGVHLNKRNFSSCLQTKYESVLDTAIFQTSFGMSLNVVFNKV